MIPHSPPGPSPHTLNLLLQLSLSLALQSLWPSALSWASQAHPYRHPQSFRLHFIHVLCSNASSSGTAPRPPELKILSHPVTLARYPASKHILPNTLQHLLSIYLPQKTVTPMKRIVLSVHHFTQVLRTMPGIQAALNMHLLNELINRHQAFSHTWWK